MDLNKLKTFFMLANTRSYTGCAQKMYLTQSAVSHAIKKLEADIGYDLIDRKSRIFKLTSEGEYLYDACTIIFNRIDATLDDLAQGKGLPVTIHLGVPVEFGSSVLIKGMASFLRCHTHIQVDFMLDANLLEPLLTDELDIIVDCVPHVHEDLVSVNLTREEYAVIASHAYIKEKSIKEIKDLKQCDLLSFDKELVWWKNFINALTSDQNFGFDKIIKISNVRGIINACLASMGVGFVPRYTILRELDQGLVVELFPETEVLNDQINIYLKKRNFEKQIFKDLIAHIKSFKLS